MPRRLDRNILFGCPKHDWKHSDTSSKVPHSVAANMAGNMSMSGWKISNFYCQKQASKMSCCLVKKVQQFQAYKCWGLTRKSAYKHVMWTWCLRVYLNKSLQESELPTCHSATEQFLLLVQTSLDQAKKKIPRTFNTGFIQVRNFIPFYEVGP